MRAVDNVAELVEKGTQDVVEVEEAVVAAHLPQPNGNGLAPVLVPAHQVRAGWDDFDQLAHLPPTRLHDGLDLLCGLEQKRACLIAAR
jgi:hypothetical protein